MMDELEATPTLDFEKLVVENPSNFIFSPHNMAKLKDLRDQLKNQIEKTKILIQENRETLNLLWDYLEEPDDYRESFLRLHQGYNLTTVSAVSTKIHVIKSVPLQFRVLKVLF